MPETSTRERAVATSQKRAFLRLWQELSRRAASDSSFPARLEAALRRERGFGSRDRRLYRELVYAAVRQLPLLQNLDEEALVVRVARWAELSPATKVFKEVWGGLTLKEGAPEVFEAPPASDEEAVRILPEWFRTECPEAFEAREARCLLKRTPLWVRLQCNDQAPVAQEWRSRGWTWQQSPLVPEAWCLERDVDITGTDAYRQGAVEVQDLGSQLILVHAGVHPGEHWLDACAGAGGKTLQLARMLGDCGSIDARDIRSEALASLIERARRAGFVEFRDGEEADRRNRGILLRRGGCSGLLLRVAAEPRESYDAVLVDAPCSGSGTWRRAPHLKWCTRTEHIRAAAERQARLLMEQAGRVRPGGRLVYGTCSLCRTENSLVLRRFLEKVPGFAPEAPSCDLGYPFDGYGTTIMPSRADTDGFYVAMLRKKTAVP